MVAPEIFYEVTHPKNKYTARIVQETKKDGLVDIYFELMRTDSWLEKIISSIAPEKHPVLKDGVAGRYHTFKIIPGDSDVAISFLTITYLNCKEMQYYTYDLSTKELVCLRKVML